MKKTANRKFGFTLVEILITVAIVGILTAIGVVSYSSVQKRSKDGRRRADLEAIRSGLEMHRVDEGEYPLTLAELETDAYLSVLPVDPKPAYNYEYNWISSTSYCLCAYLEGSDSESSCDCGTGTCGVTACNYSVQNP